MFATIRQFVELSGLSHEGDVPQPDCYVNAATSIDPCGMCIIKPTLLDKATGQTGDKEVFTFRHDESGWVCDANN
eukprot:CAMPEP_0173390960 /NCGR_PEP_ID=MMETSP1356-20130122/16710_1 /TAXON_ID=77927 ORGANISM="Hemiselmis virescens, Strain PCC157" /NCGR_SAMPLE_ID=MMETSP1356 /ASSEMBLY_ACC=CAM_ASM_000847 /LENGTH=74 /DNA_ID=CAMNT_0014348461 /DNA_START=19 /DNA_END=243 /DNA_ORIENTATION=-